MLNDPFGDPFRLRGGTPLNEIFQNKVGGFRPRKPVAAPVESEPEFVPDVVATTSQESKGDKAILKNPRWITETVGFNEEADISVDAFLPESEAHKTRVVFELFARTPAGVEEISKAEGHVSKGRPWPASRCTSPSTGMTRGTRLPKWTTSSPPSTAPPTF